VLIIDIDPQGNTTSGFGIDKESLDFTTYDLLISDTDVSKCILPTTVENLFIIPSSVQLAGAEIELVELKDREVRLKRVIDQVIKNYDYIFIDCPPSLGLLAINALTVANSVLIPIQCEYYALEGVGQMMKTIEMVRQSLNPYLEIQGVVLSMFDGRTNLSIQVVDEVKKYFKGKVYTTIIPRNVRLAEAPSHGLPIIQYDPKSRGAEAYMELSEEFLDLEEEDVI
jgi:chromosome partitioning protein